MNLSNGCIKFSALKVGDKFVFYDDRACRPTFNVVYGPFIKTSSTKYLMTDGGIMTVETTTYRVKKLDS